MQEVQLEVTLCWTCPACKTVNVVSEITPTEEELKEYVGDASPDDVRWRVIPEFVSCIKCLKHYKASVKETQE